MKLVLNSAENENHISMLMDGQISYLPAKRVELLNSIGAGGACRYIRRTKNSDLYVTGAGMEGIMLCSTDGGHTWTSRAYHIENLDFCSAFGILRDDTFLLAFMPPGRQQQELFIARSTDYGRTWMVAKVDTDLSPHRYVMGWSSDILELTDDTVLLTLDLRAGPDAIKNEDSKDLPFELQGSFPYVFRSHDGGRTWDEKQLIAMHGGEAHLLQLPSGKVLSCVRKQRWHRLPGDPVSPIDMKLQNGYRPQFDSEERGSENHEETNRIKNIVISESDNGGHTWINERQATDFLQCSGDFALLDNGTLVLSFLHRFPDDQANTGIRTRVSDDEGKTWRDEMYIISQGNSEEINSGSSYPGNIAMPDGTVITVCGNWVEDRLRLEAVHWRPLARKI